MTATEAADIAADRALLATACAAAREAGGLLAANAAEWRATASESGRDVKLVADAAAQRALADRLPEHPILSEESPWRGTEHPAAPFWVIDPLDGSINYRQGIDLCAVSVALVRAGIPVLGAVYDFARGEMFNGIVGAGAWLNDAPIAVSAVGTRERAVLATGLPLGQDYSPAGLAAFAEGLRPWRKVRMLGSAALSLAYVASGRVDAYREEGILAWDVAAGCALVRAAGGAYSIVGRIGTDPLRVFAHNGRLA